MSTGKLLSAALAALPILASSGVAADELAPVFRLTDDGRGAWGLHVVGDAVLFFRQGAGVADELWRSDGTPAGTTRIAAPGRVASVEFPLVVSDEPTRFALHDGRLFFVAADPEHGAELWLSDGTPDGTRMVADLNPGPDGAHPTALTSTKGGLYFAADDGTIGRELWRTDGTALGTVQVADVRPGEEGSDPRHVRAVRDKVFFDADDGVVGREPWRTDGTADGTVLVADVRPGPLGSDPAWLTPWRKKLFFVADDGVHGREPWRSNGSPSGTRLHADLAQDPFGEDGETPETPPSGPATGDPHRLVPYASELLLFATQLGIVRNDTPQLVRLRPGARPEWITDTERIRAYGWLAVAGPRLYFTGSKYPRSWSTYAGGEASRVFLPAEYVPDEHPLTPFATHGERLFLGVDMPGSGLDPWVSDGTQEGTYRIADLEEPSLVYPGIGEGVAHGGLLFLRAGADLVAIPLNVLCATGVCGVEEGRCFASRDPAALKLRWSGPGGGSQLSLHGEAELPAGEVVDPAATGLRLTVRSAAGVVLDALVPAGLRPSRAAPGWTVGRHGDQWLYHDRSGAVAGVRDVDVRAKPDGDVLRVRFRIRARGGGVERPVRGPLDVVVDLDGATAISNRCVAAEGVALGL